MPVFLCPLKKAYCRFRGARMKLVLLPGMDGTGLLFEEFLSFYDGDSQLIALPTDISQDYASLTSYVSSVPPEKDCVIFFASFLSCPNKALLVIAKKLPLKKLYNLPFSTFIHRLLFIGSRTSPKQISLFNKVLESVPDTVLRARINSMIEMQGPRQLMTIPAVYIQATEE